MRFKAPHAELLSNERVAVQPTVSSRARPEVAARDWSLLFWLLLAGLALAQSYLDPVYLEAVRDAEQAEPNEICRQLVALTADQGELVWEGEPGKSRVLMLRWVSGPQFDEAVGRDMVVAEDSFVTPVPAVADWFRSRGVAPTVGRLEQLLGLPPGTGKNRLVELWVWPESMVRPSPDPEVTDREAGLEFPAGVSNAHRAWFDARREGCYRGPAPYPWTRLGYTYDWGSKDHVGLSEFVVLRGTTVGVRAVWSNEDYFREVHSPETRPTRPADRLSGMTIQPVMPRPTAISSARPERPDQVTLSHQAPPPGGHVGVHGMIAFGSGHFSHIPMFHEPHDYQAVMEVKLEHPELEEGTSFGGELHTFVPDEFSLGDLLGGRLTELEGTLFRGNFEAGGTPLLEGVKVRVNQVVDSRHLDRASRGPEELSYVLYGKPGDTYLVHPIFGNADFDQIVKVDCPEAGLSAEELRQGVAVTVPGRENKVESRLLPGAEPVRAELVEEKRAISLRIERELSCLVGPHFTHGPNP